MNEEIKVRIVESREVKIKPLLVKSHMTYMTFPHDNHVTLFW